MGLLMNVLAIALANAHKTKRPFGVDEQDIEFGNPWWFVYAGISCFLVLFAGIMSGLTLGLMSMGLVELEILQRSGTSTEKKQAATILPVVQKQHQLLVTLLLCNAAAMEALPIYLDKIFHPVVAIILSVTFVLAFGEIIPQAICSRYGLAVGANLVWLVRVFMIICYPISYPIGKVLDAVLGHHDALFRRAQLKALVSIHGIEVIPLNWCSLQKTEVDLAAGHDRSAGKGGELTHDEITIISGALDLTEKTAAEAMTPIESTFSLDVNSKLDWEAIGKILARGHSRVPVYSGHPKNIIGLLLVKSLLTIRAETETPVSAVSIRRMPRVPADMPLYDILNEFQKGSSHMAAVEKVSKKDYNLASDRAGVKGGENKFWNGDSHLTTPLLCTHDEKSDTVIINVAKVSMQNQEIKFPSLHQNGVTTNNSTFLAEDIEEGEVIGIITLEDVFEELLQEEIVDETDVYVDVHKRIRVAAAASSVARAPSARKATGQKASNYIHSCRRWDLSKFIKHCRRFFLRGEISVICQDVRLLKEKFDDRVPLSKSFCSSQTSCILASSSSSLKSMVPDQVPDPADLLLAPEKMDTVSNHEEERKASEDVKSVIHNKDLLDDGWEIFDNRELCM
ncbi:hypothetical protein RND71_022962 [Anisodus tanguticus]|uniref:CNNM transmembrane domain-containing protein n=1 Tax=Anisodus tanguticus TaxID=243964 RepID=A0AAE1V6K0_9SOLA|nr:hypothetical protein RND71_022962 [Anisodus tanguticus]